MAHPPLGSRRFGFQPAAGLVWPWLRSIPRHGHWAWLASELVHERERWFLWLPVGLGFGVAFYFSLPAEPPGWLGAALLLPIVFFLGHLWRTAPDTGSPAREICLALAALVAGLTAAQTRVQLVEAPVLERRGAYEVEGRVVLIEDRVRGERLVLAEPVLAGVPPERTPVRIRFTVRAAVPDLVPGDRVRGRVMLMPPSPPAAPGDFDFAQQAFFMQLGAVGYALGGVERVTTFDRLTFEQRIAGVRQRIAAEIQAAVPGPAGAVAVALMTGLRGAIPDFVWRDMQVAGIAHLLAISGLHLGLVAGTLFFAARIAIALAPPLALRVPGKKAAAGFALVGAFVYLLLTGGTVPTQRAFIMTALMLLAVMVDRNPFSMRLVAWAAIAVLLVQPESLLGASFQMSFAAVVALIAVYETGVGKRPAGAGGLDWRLFLYVAGVALTTVVASAATAPFAVYHFSRLPTYGIVVNLVAVPLTAFWVMPLGLAGLVLLPFGLGALCFVPMGQGIEIILTLAGGVAEMPGAALRLAKPPDAALVATVLGGLWLCLWRRPWRRLGLLGPALGLTLTMLARPPDLLVDQTGELVAVRQADGGLAISPWRRDGWVTEGWLRRMGREEAMAWPEPGTTVGETLRCDALGCIASHRGQSVAIARRPEAIEEDCARADLVLAWPRVERCPNGRPLIGPDALYRAGGLAIWLEPGRIRTRTVREHRGDRPWAR